MKPVIDSIVRKLEDLCRVLEVHGYSEQFVSEVRRVSDKLKSTRTPSVPPKVLWDRYAAVLAVIEEAVETASRDREELAVYSLISSVKEGVESLCNLMKKAYYVERFEMALPALMAVLITVYRALVDGVNISWYFAVVAALSLVLTTLKPMAGFIVLGSVGVLMVYYSVSPMDSMAGLILVTASILYTYLIYVSKSANFRKKLSEVSENIYLLVKQGMKVRTLDLDKALSDLKSKYALPDTGVFKFINRDEVLRYKVFMTLVTSSRLNAIKGAPEVGKSE